MSRVSFVVAATVAALMAATPAAADQAKSITATGTDQVKVVPKNRNSNSSISAAVDAARKAGIAGAMSEAHEYAGDYARAAGLTLGAVSSVSDAQNNGFSYYGPGPFFGPFGPNQFCGKAPQPVFSTVNGKRKLVRVKRVHRCFVPPFEVTSLTVTFAAS
jgi:uncharacterized protein YggE